MPASCSCRSWAQAARCGGHRAGAAARPDRHRARHPLPAGPERDPPLRGHPADAGAELRRRAARRHDRAAARIGRGPLSADHRPPRVRRHELAAFGGAGPFHQGFVEQGYATLSYSARGQGLSCGTPASRTAGCEQGWTHLADARFESRDAQYLAGLMADEGLIQPQKIGVTGSSYGGGQSLLLATLRDRIMKPDGEFAPWRSPEGTPMRIAAAAPQIGWSDLAYALVPTGRMLDYRKRNRYGHARRDRQAVVPDRPLYARRERLLRPPRRRPRGRHSQLVPRADRRRALRPGAPRPHPAAVRALPLRLLAPGQPAALAAPDTGADRDLQRLDRRHHGPGPGRALLHPDRPRFPPRQARPRLHPRVRASARLADGGPADRGRTGPRRSSTAISRATAPPTRSTA